MKNIYLHIDDSHGHRTWQVVTYNKLSTSAKSCDNFITWPFELTWMKNDISSFPWILWQAKYVVVNHKVSVATKSSHMTLWSHWHVSSLENLKHYISSSIRLVANQLDKVVAKIYKVILLFDNIETWGYEANQKRYILFFLPRDLLSPNMKRRGNGYF